MPKVKKIPQRQCVGCREMKDKKALLRVVKSPEGTVSLDFGGRPWLVWDAEFRRDLFQSHGVLRSSSAVQKNSSSAAGTGESNSRTIRGPFPVCLSGFPSSRTFFGGCSQ